MADLPVKIVRNMTLFCHASWDSGHGSSRYQTKATSSLKIQESFMVPMLKKFHQSQDGIKKYQLKMAKKEMEVVKGLDVEKYMGRWYEIASLPSRFEPKSGVDTRATHTLNPDGTVHILNETWTDGKRGYIEGTAWKVDPKSDEAKLKARFYVPPFLPIIPVTGDYWVLHIDGAHQYAVVGHPTSRYLWIMGRQPRINEKTYNRLMEIAKREGYDVSKLKKTTHSNTPPESEDVPTDTKGIWWIKCIFGN